MQTLQQERAKHALVQVKSWVGLGDSSKLKARSSELPFMIHANGLGQAAAFFKSKKNKDGYDVVFAALQSWLRQKGCPLADRSDLMQAVVEADLHTYRMAQAESIQYMDWIKKFACAYLAD